MRDEHDKLLSKPKPGGRLACKSLHASQVAHLAGTYPGFFCRTEEYLFYSCLKGFPELQICKGPFTPPSIEWHFELKVSSPKYQCTRGHRVSTLDHLIRIPVHWLLHHCASTNQECNERKLPTCVYSLVHNWANTSSLTKAMVLSFCQTSTGKCMHHPTEKKLLCWVQHSTIA